MGSMVTPMNYRIGVENHSEILAKLLSFLLLKEKLFQSLLKHTDVHEPYYYINIQKGRASLEMSINCLNKCTQTM